MDECVMYRVCDGRCVMDSVMYECVVYQSDILPCLMSMSLLHCFER